MKFIISDLMEFDFSEVDPSTDLFEINGKVFRFSDSVCHNCWDGGTVLESEDEYWCVRCKEKLTWVAVTIRFQHEASAMEEKFLLPTSWNDEQLGEWKENFTERRNHELALREKILKNPESGEVYFDE